MECLCAALIRFVRFFVYDGQLIVRLLIGLAVLVELRVVLHLRFHMLSLQLTDVLVILLFLVGVNRPDLEDAVFTSSGHEEAAGAELDDPNGLLVCPDVLHEMKVALVVLRPLIHTRIDLLVLEVEVTVDPLVFLLDWQERIFVAGLLHLLAPLHVVAGRIQSRRSHVSGPNLFEVVHRKV